MEIFSYLLTLLLTSMVIKNVILSQFLGMCPFLGVSKKTKNAIGMGMTVLVILIISSILSWILYTFVLIPLNLIFLKTITFIITIASLVQLIEIILKRFSPTLYKSLGIFLPLITTNCAVLGIALLNIQNNYNFLETLFYSVGAALGFLMVLIIFSGIRERLELTNVPKAFKGLPIALITASIMSVAFMGFVGIL